MGGLGQPGVFAVSGDETSPEVLLREALGDRYAMEGEVARGGMATVYRARAAATGELVAIKIMHPRLATRLNADRFLREIDVVRSMQHPLIVPLRDSGSAGNLPYYIMPYIEGESLHVRLQRERRLGLEAAVAIAGDVADALGYAHSRGVLHRDVKPENILLAGGRALVADFGLARATGAAEYQKLTETGVIVGTVFYMSPEQLREDPLDARSDIYSLGCILYEMLTGVPPFIGLSLRELATRILRSPAPSVRQVRPEIPAAIDRIIERALAKSAQGRFGSMEELKTALHTGC